MVLKCVSVTGSIVMARFDLNHPYMVHCGHMLSDETVYVVHQCAPTVSVFHKAD